MWMTNAYSPEKEITVTFCIYPGHIYDYSFPYTDDFFRTPSVYFSKQFAQASIGLAVSAFRDEGMLTEQYETYLAEAGFSDIYAFGYDQPTSPETLSGVLAHKKIDDFTLIACAPCGQGYEKEWGGNLTLGYGERHEGFNTGAMILEEQLASYRQTHNISGKIKIWITGFSRSGVGNLTAADLIESGEYEDVYAYLFGVPRTTKNAVAYEGIYNICGQYDPITSVPCQGWGYERYGLDLYTPSQEADSNYQIYKASASRVHEDISGEPLRNNPESNHQLSLLLKFLQEIFPTGKDYADDMQDIILGIWSESNEEHIPEILIAAMNELDKLDTRQQYSKEAFIDYIMYIVSTYAGSWNNNATLMENLMREHLPLTYMAWVFSDIPAEELYQSGILTRIIMIDGEVNVAVYDRETFLGSIDPEGTVTTADGSAENSLPRIFMRRTGLETTLILPTDRDYRVIIGSDRTQELFYYDVVYMPNHYKGIGDMAVIGSISEGSYELSITDNNGLPDLKVLSGSFNNVFTADFEYSTALIMRNESSQGIHLTLGGLLRTLAFILSGLVILGIVCFVIAIIHFIKRRHGHEKYSPWWVIVPHLIMIVIFAGLTQFLSFNLFRIGLLKNACAAIVVLLIFLLALRALIRNRCISNLAVAAAMLALTVLTWFLFDTTFFASCTLLHVILYAVCLAALVCVTIRGFYVKRDGQSKSLL